MPRPVEWTRASTFIAGCGGREVELWLFVKRDEAEAWVEG